MRRNPLRGALRTNLSGPSRGGTAWSAQQRTATSRDSCRTRLRLQANSPAASERPVVILDALHESVNTAQGLHTSSQDQAQLCTNKVLAGLKCTAGAD